MSNDEQATTESVTDQPSSGPNKRSKEELFELLATILLALAAIATSWAGFQSAKWGGVQATNFSQAGAARTESVRFSTLAGQQASVDITTYFNWLNAVIDDIERGDIVAPQNSADYEPTAGTLSGFTFQRFREEFQPATRAWLDTSPFENDSAPSTPFVMDEYQLAATDEAQRLQADADQKASVAGEANQTSDNYVVSAVLFASALFFAAMSSKLVADRYKRACLGIAALVFLGTLIYVMALPIEI